jgi:hypothetical protein
MPLAETAAVWNTECISAVDLHAWPGDEVDPGQREAGKEVENSPPRVPVMMFVSRLRVLRHGQGDSHAMPAPDLSSIR